MGWQSRPHMQQAAPSTMPLLHRDYKRLLQHDAPAQTSATIASRLCALTRLDLMHRLIAGGVCKLHCTMHCFACISGYNRAEVCWQLPLEFAWLLKAGADSYLQMPLSDTFPMTAPDLSSSQSHLHHFCAADAPWSKKIRTPARHFRLGMLLEWQALQMSIQSHCQTAAGTCLILTTEVR